MARQLPILGQKPAPAPGTVPPPEDERPPWHWSGIGAVLTFALWLPLSMLAELVASRAVAALVPGGSPSDVAQFLASASSGTRALVVVARVAPHVVITLVLGAFAGGAMVGRFGKSAGAKEAAVGGLMAASAAWALTAVELGLSRTWIVWPFAAGIGTLAGWLGGRWGVAKRASE